MLILTFQWKCTIHGLSLPVSTVNMRRTLSSGRKNLCDFVFSNIWPQGLLLNGSKCQLISIQKTYLLLCHLNGSNLPVSRSLTLSPTLHVIALSVLRSFPLSLIHPHLILLSLHFQVPNILAHSIFHPFLPFRCSQTSHALHRSIFPIFSAFLFPTQKAPGHRLFSVFFCALSPKSTLLKSPHCIHSTSLHYKIL